MEWGATVDFQIISSRDFQHLAFYLDRSTVSLYLHRVVQDSTSIIELHFIFTAWSPNEVSYQHGLIGWLMSLFQQNPVLPAHPTLNERYPGIALHMFPSIEDARNIWKLVSELVYQISIPYIVRASY